MPSTTASEQGPATGPPAKRPPKRERLIAAALEEIHRQGYAGTSLAKIAEAADVPIGNVYYYFKTKDDLVRAVIDDHVAHVQGLLDEASRAADPAARLGRLLELMASNSDDVAAKGCPLGCLSQDLVKADGRFEDDRNRLFADQLDWFEEQFRAAGKGDAAHDLAVHLLACTQGASTVCQALGQPDVLRTELARARAWLDSVLG